MPRRARGDGSIYRKQGSRFWWIKFTANGRVVRESTRSTKMHEAAAMLRDRLRRVQDGEFDGRALAALRFEALQPLLEADYAQNGNRSWDRAARAFKHLEQFFANWLVSRIDTANVAAYYAARLEEGAARATIHCEIAILKRSITVARTMKHTKHRLEFVLKKIENARLGFFERPEFELVCVQLADELRSVVTFAYLTGWRKEEVLQLEWSMVDLDNESMLLPYWLSKNKDGRLFPYGPLTELRAILAQQRALTTELERETKRNIRWVFHRNGRPIKSYDAAWRGACVRAATDTRDDGTTFLARPKLAGMLFHDFRRTAVRNLERAGVSRGVAMQMTGHKTEEVYRRYNIVNERDLKTGAAQLNEFLRRGASPRADGQGGEG